MADIKTREIMKGTIKTFDRAEAAAHRIKEGSIRTKESAEEAYQAKRLAIRICAGQANGSRKVSRRKSRTQAARDGEERD
mgnify:CR=1 FL=1